MNLFISSAKLVITSVWTEVVKDWWWEGGLREFCRQVWISWDKVSLI